MKLPTAFLIGLAFLTVALPTAGSAQDCRLCARQSTIEQCVRCSLNTREAKAKHYSEAGIRSWCVQNQPRCRAFGSRSKQK
jgi:hypothetical protein